jgi:hypothetical protein
VNVNTPSRDRSEMSRAGYTAFVDGTGPLVVTENVITSLVSWQDPTVWPLRVSQLLAVTFEAPVVGVHGRPCPPLCRHWRDPRQSMPTPSRSPWTSIDQLQVGLGQFSDI